MYPDSAHSKQAAAPTNCAVRTFVPLGRLTGGGHSWESCSPRSSVSVASILLLFFLPSIKVEPKAWPRVCNSSSRMRAKTESIRDARELEASVAGPQIIHPNGESGYLARRWTAKWVARAKIA